MAAPLQRPRRPLGLAVLIAAQCAWLAVLVAGAVGITGWGTWTPLPLLVGLVGAVLVSDLLARRLEVAGTVNFSGSDLYLIPAMALLGPIPAAVIAIATELLMASTTRGMTSLKTFNNAVALGSYALAGGILVQGGAALAGWAIGDLGHLALVALAPFVANAICLGVLAAHWRVVNGDRLRDFATTFTRVLPWYAIVAVLAPLIVDVYARSGLRGCVGLLVALLLGEWLLARLSRVEVALRLERDRAGEYLDIARTMIVVLDRSGRVAVVNRRACDTLGMDETALRGRWWLGLVEDGRCQAAFSALLRGEAGEGVHGFEGSIRAAGGELRTIAWTARTVYESGRPNGVLASGEDVTERRSAEAEVAFLAFHDPLTRLPNRTRLEERLEHAVAGDAPVALAFVDLDGFKSVNDSLGHVAGDELLCQVADRLRATVRAGDVVSRRGGDEFTVLLTSPGADPIAGAHRAARDIAEALAQPFRIAGHTVPGGASVGVAVHPYDAADAAGLLRVADSRMYEQKRAARAARPAA